MFMGKVQGVGSDLNLEGGVICGERQVYKACIQRVLVYVSETWPVKMGNMKHFERTEPLMVKWMCG